MKSVVQIQRQGKVKDVKASAAASGLPDEESREPRGLPDHVRTAPTPASGRCGLVPEGAGGPDLSAVRGLCGSSAGSVWTECLPRLPPLYPGQRSPPADPL